MGILLFIIPVSHHLNFSLSCSMKFQFCWKVVHHALEESRPKSVLVHSLSVCISLLDPKRLASASYQAFRSNLSHGALVTASPETVDGMLESLGECWIFCPYLFGLGNLGSSFPGLRKSYARNLFIFYAFNDFIHLLV